ncbi:Glutamate decarboxylase [Brachionus plicatilis]|uniref:Glutamate decarboxylase n=1 Tax=Brachionus plicatilis TaxID=10195 RepID=A0A3M7R4J5_BRAPC|nr:Glutamate decarboxylase [Brachionus plicatilis]
MTFLYVKVSYVIFFCKSITLFINKDILPNGEYETTCEFLQRILDLMLVYIQKANDRTEKILKFQYPDDLKNSLDLEIKSEPLSLKKLIEDCQMVMDNAVKTGHPRFFNQLSQGLDIVSLAGEWITATTNTNMFTYEIAPVYNLIEMAVLDKMRTFIGWEEPCDGLFNPGGSISNLYAVQRNLMDCMKHQKLLLLNSRFLHFSIKQIDN